MWNAASRIECSKLNILIVEYDHFTVILPIHICDTLTSKDVILSISNTCIFITFFVTFITYRIIIFCTFAAGNGSGF